jgi:CubicO group peptidase (beta-lactamase class C family)
MSIRGVRAVGLTLSLLVLSVSACEDTTDDPRGDAGHDHDAAAEAIDFSRFDRALQKAIDDHNADADEGQKIAGASAAVVHEKLGVLHTQGFGEFDADRLYLIASSSKILSVGVLMRLADQGKLDIDKPIGDYLKDWGDPKAAKINVAQLVSNSSGLPSLTEVSGAASDTKSPYFSNLCQYQDTGTLQDCGKILYETEPPRDPDTAFTYGGSQWQLAGAVAEVVSGKPWAELIDETYRSPCEVPSLGYTNQFGKSGGTGYPTFFDAKKENLPVTKNPSIEGGAYVTVGDYAKLLVMHLRGGTCGDERVLSKEATERMRKDRIAEYGGSTGFPQTPGYGLGFWIDPTGKVVTDGGAYGSFPLLDLERRYGVFIAIELTSAVGAGLGAAVKPSLDAIFDEANID